MYTTLDEAIQDATARQRAREQAYRDEMLVQFTIKRTEALGKLDDHLTRIFTPEQLALLTLHLTGTAPEHVNYNTSYAGEVWAEMTYRNQVVKIEYGPFAPGVLHMSRPGYKDCPGYARTDSTWEDLLLYLGSLPILHTCGHPQRHEGDDLTDRCDLCLQPYEGDD